VQREGEALQQLARIAVEGPATKDSLTTATRIIRRATGASEVLLVYAEDRNFLTCSDTGRDSHPELKQTALAMIQRQAEQANCPVAFNLVGGHVEDFTSALGDNQREFLAISVPTAESASEICILRGPWEITRARVLRFMESATPALTIILDQLLNADRGRRLAQQLQTLANAAQVLTRSEDVAVALRDLATAVSAATGFEYIVNIDLYDTAAGRFVLRILSEHRYTTKSLGQVWEASFNPERPDPWNMRVMTTLQPSLAPDMQNDPVYPEYVRKFYARALLRSAIDFPLLFQDEFLGTMSFVSFKPRSFPPEEVNFLQGFVSQAAVALKALQMHNDLQRYAQEIRRSADRYIHTTNLTGDVIARLDEHGNWTFLNDAACQFYGKPREELLGSDSRAYTHPDDLEATAVSIRCARTERRLATGLINRQVTPAGVRVMEWNGYPFFDEEGHYVGIQITGRDITERREMEEALQESERRYRLLAENTSDLIWTMDLGLRYTYVSPSIRRMRGYTPEEIVGASIGQTLTPASREVARKALAEELAQEGVEGADIHRARTVEFEVYRKDGSTIWTEMSMIFLRNADGQPTGILGVTRDISERKRADEERAKLHAELEVRATTDSLTGLYNHAHFYQRLAEEIDRSKRYVHGFAVVMLDVDSFKRFNDSYGHQAGDDMLRNIADGIRAGLRRSDLAFRYGGDEFAAILPHADLARAQAVVDRINRRVAKSVKQLDGESAGRLTLSAGVACFPDDGNTPDELVSIADVALYGAKWATRTHGAMEEEYEIRPTATSVQTPQAMESRMLSAAAGSLTAALRDLGVPDPLAELNMRTIAALGTLAEIKDAYVRGHQERTSDWAATLAQKMGLPADRVRATRFAGRLHDLGKAGVSKSILNKPGKLTEEEYAKIKEHSPLGSMMILSQAEALRQVVPIVRHHHERIDGKGYPDGLAGEEIPLEARILAVVDSFDAMTHERVYRKALSFEEAIAELKRCAGTQFDAAVVEAFLAARGAPEVDAAAAAQLAGEIRELATVKAGKPE
jgi:diguanylate cyclase (GGDEF)-like protein/PAS domain S-box-containing protein